MSADESPLRQTPLHAEHVRLGGRMVGFGGWSMPVQYTGIIEEHHAVRNALGVFDISHMGEFFVSGEGAEDWLNRMLTNNVQRLAIGQCQYTLLLNEEGGVIDDLIVYRIEPTRYLLVVNASKIAEDFAWMHDHLPASASGDIDLSNASDDYAGFAVQGPRATEFFRAFTSSGSAPPARNEIATISSGDAPLYVARTGYTGEDGFEIFCPSAAAVRTFQEILEGGRDCGIKPCGLGARDTLRLEMCYPLNGADLTPDTTPLEAGLGFFVDLEKQEFIGRDALARQRADGVKRRLAAFRMSEKSPPPRSHYPVFRDGQRVGETSSGTLSPSLNTGIGMAYLPVEIARPGEQIEIDIRGRRFPAVIEKKPLYRRSTATS